MLTKILKKTIVTLLMMAMVLGGATFFLMQRYELNFIDFTNKVGLKLNLSTANKPLLLHPKQHTDRKLPSNNTNTFPKILLAQLRDWDGEATPDFFKQRLANLKRLNLGFKLNCKKLTIESQINCYLAAPTKASLDKLAQALISYDFIAPTSQGQYGNAWQFALVLDTAKGSAQFSQRDWQRLNTKIVDILNQYLILLDGGGASLWHGRANLAANAFLLASVLSVNTVAEQELYQRAYGHFYDFYRAISATEIWPEGYNYWINSRALPVILGLSALKNSQSDANESTAILTTITRIGLWHIYLTRPDFKIEGWGDEGPRTDLKDESLKVIDVIAQITDQTAIINFADTIRQHYRASGYYVSYRWLLPLLYQPKQQLSHSPLPESELFGRDFSNHLSIHSDWGQQQTFITYRAGHSFAHHQHYDAGHFSIFKGAPLAVNASQYNGDVFSANRNNFAIRTLAKNSLLIQDRNELVQPHRSFTHNVAAGGQRMVMPVGSNITSFEHWQQQLFQGKHFGGARLLNYQYQPDLFTAIGSDLTGAYNSIRYATPGNSAKVKRVERTLVYLNKLDMVLIDDRVITTNPQHQVKWLLHSVNQPEMADVTLLQGDHNNGILSSDQHLVLIKNGKSTLRMDIVAPQRSNTRLIGGDDYRYYVESDGDDSRLNGEFFDQGVKDRPWYDLAKWRIELSGQQQQLNHHFLVALQPRIKGQQPSREIVPQLIKHPNATIAVFDDVLVIAGLNQDPWSVDLPPNISTLAIFVERSSLLTYNDPKPRMIKLQQGFNYIPLSNQSSGILSIEQTQSLLLP